MKWVGRFHSGDDTHAAKRGAPNDLVDAVSRCRFEDVEARLVVGQVGCPDVPNRQTLVCQCLGSGSGTESTRMCFMCERSRQVDFHEVAPH